MAKLLLGSVVGPQGPQGTPGVNGSQGPQGIPGPNEVTATTDVVGLTSGQLLYNNGGKVGSVEIVDNLETEASNKPLSSKMGAWLGYFKRDMEDRGYLFAKSKTHFDFANTSGKYKISDASDQPVPGVTASWLVDVTNNGEGGMVQIANCVKGDATVLGKTYRRIYISTGGGWQAWKEIPDKSYVDSAIGQNASDLNDLIERSNITDTIVKPKLKIYADTNEVITVSNQNYSFTKNGLGFGQHVMFELPELFEWNISTERSGQFATNTVYFESLGQGITITVTNLKALELTWEQINTMGQNNTISNALLLGDTKDITVNSEIIEMQLIAFDHDNLTNGGKAKTSWLSKNCLNTTHKMTVSAISADGWPVCSLRTLLSGSFYDSIPSNLKSIIKSTKKYSTTGGYTDDNIWIPSWAEISGGGSELEPAYPIFTTNASRVKYRNSIAERWWSRTSAYSSGNRLFTSITTGGISQGFGVNQVTSVASVAIGFCI